MAQIIKHRRGSLESVASATKRAGELLVVTGSSGITATNGNSILFLGVDGSTVTPANKILQGTTVPDLTGASYDTSVDGIPYYDTSAQKLYILNKGGNVEIQATANTGGTGIVSGSSQVIELLPTGTVSGSSQVVGILGSLNSFSASQETKNSTLATYTSSVDSRLNQLSTDSGSQAGRLTNLESFSASADFDIAELFSTASDHETRVDALEAFSSSLDVGFVTQAELASATGALETADLAIEGRLDNIEGFTSSIDTTIKTKLNVEAVVSSSAQVVGILSSLNSYTSSNDTDVTELFSTASDHESRIDTIETAIGGGSAIDVRLNNLEATSASHDDRLDQLETDSGSQAGRLSNLESFSSSIETAITVDGSNVTVNGNFTVSGTTTTVNSTTVDIGDNIVQLNGSAAAFGGLIIVDATAPSQVSGSLLWDATNDYWIAGPSGSESKVLLKNGDGVISGSSQVNADSITNFDSNVKDKLNSDGVISGSSQVQIDSVTGFGTFSSSVDSRLDTVEESLGGGGSIGTRVSSLEAFSSSQESKNSTLATYTASVDGDLTELFATASNHEVRIDSLESFSSSLEGGFVNNAELAAATGALETADSAQQARLSSLEGFSGSQETKNSTLATYTASVDSRLNQLSTDSGSQAGRLSNLESFTQSIDTTIKTKLDADAVVSSSAQIVSLLSNQATDFGTGRVSGDDFGDVGGTSTFTGSFVGDGSSLTGLVTDLRISGSTGNDVVSLLTDDLTFAGGTAISVAVTDNTITVNASDASTSAKGIASFGSTNFSVSSGNVTIKSGGVPAAALASDVAGTGISLNGVDNSIEVDYGSTAGTAVEGNTSLTVQGTANEISVSGGSVTLGAGGTVTIGLPDSVTIATASVDGDLSVGGNVEITGNLSVLGTTTTIDSTTVQIGDNIIELNIGGAQSTAGIQVTDATSPNTVSGSLIWDGTNDYWKAGALGSEKELARINSSLSSGSVLRADANGLLVDSVIFDDGTDATFSGDIIVSGLTANTFLVSDGSKTLTSVAPANAGDLIQWNGSSFVASNTIDGGTF
jgi:hypothetical protein